MSINYKNILEQLNKDLIEKVVVGAIIQNNNKVLMLKRIDDDFMGGLVELPSGTVDKGETLEQALVRELKEETNLDINEITSFNNSFDYLSNSGKKTRQLNFNVSVKNIDNIKLEPTEHNAYYFVEKSLTELNKLNISEETKNSIML